MSSVKAKIDESSVKEFLDEKYGRVENIQFIQGGQLSQAFSYEVNMNKFILKIRKDIEALRKEKEIFERLGQEDSEIPIPRVHDLGLFKELKDHSLYYCISDKCEGVISYHLPPDVGSSLKTNMLGLLYKIHQVDISDTQNYGEWSHFGNASHKTWKSFMKDYTQSKLDYLFDFFKGQPEEIEFVEMLSNQLKELFDYCPEVRYLIHGDFGQNNILAKESGDITGIIDWELSKFGDFAYDLGWIDYWAIYGGQSYSGDYEKLCKELHKDDLEHFHERVLCYKLSVAIHMAWFFSKSGQLEAYEDGKKRVLDAWETWL